MSLASPQVTFQDRYAFESPKHCQRRHRWRRRTRQTIVKFGCISIGTASDIVDGIAQVTGLRIQYHKQIAFLMRSRYPDQNPFVEDTVTSTFCFTARRTGFGTTFGPGFETRCRTRFRTRFRTRIGTLFALRPLFQRFECASGQRINIPNWHSADSSDDTRRTMVRSNLLGHNPDSR